MSRYHEKTVTSVFVRNVHRECRPDDLRKLFSKYGDISDVYIPQDYHTHEPRGFAYIQFDYREDAEDAVYYLDGCSLFGRALAVCVAQSDRKSPGAMRRGPRRGSGGPSRRRRSYSRSRSPPRRRRRSPSRSRSPRRPSPSPPRRRSMSPRRSRSPVQKHLSRSLSRSRSPR